ncbi:MAG: TolC family protein [Candidatus Rokubacteria bacterium]|nr:TolC family protein [Candidatus Rokubacteria bacterium]MBI3824861.1 TolC family protein [Candidatus Rokubacteria bacterium]
MTAPPWRMSCRLVAVAWAVALCLVPSVHAQDSSPAPAVTLPLTRDDVAFLALLNSRDLKVERFAGKLAERELPTERAAFHPFISMEASMAESKSLAGSSLAGSDSPFLGTTAWSAGIRNRLVSGATASVDYVSNRVLSNSSFFTLNPQFQSSVVFGLTQPLLKGFGPAVNTWRIKVAGNQVRIAHYQLQARVSSVLAEAENTYWDLAMASKNLEIRGRALELTRQLARRTEELVSEGILAETALLQARTSVLQRDADLVVAKNMRQEAERRLRDLLNFAPEDAPSLVALDEPSPEARNVDVAQAVKDALSHRPELSQAELDLKNKELALLFAKNQVLPQLNFFSSYGLTGLSGTPVPQSQTATVTIPIINNISITRDVTITSASAPPRAAGGYWTAVHNLLSADFPTWKVGFNLSFPLGNVAAQSQLEKAELEKRRSELVAKNVERAIAIGVEGLGAQLQSTFNVIQVARAVREQVQQRLDVTREKFQLGLASVSEVIEAQRDLVTSEQDEWRAIIDYNKVFVLFEQATGALLAKYRVDL